MCRVGILTVGSHDGMMQDIVIMEEEYNNEGYNLQELNNDGMRFVRGCSHQ